MPVRPLVVVSHERSGTHLTIDTVRHHFDAYAAPYANLDRLRPDHPEPMPDAEFRDALAAPRVWKTHTLSDLDAFFGPRADDARALLDAAHVVYVGRDGRDVMASFHVYAKSYDPAADVPFAEFLRGYRYTEPTPLRERLSPPAYWQAHVLDWLATDAAVVRFEDLALDSAGVVADLAALVGAAPSREAQSLVRQRSERLSDGVLARAVEKGRKLAARAVRGVEYTAVGFSRGRSGSWRRSFSADDLAFFDAEAADAMRRLGYTVDRSGL